MKKYDELVNNIATWVGSEANVIYFTHCVTRLRFNVKDKGLVDMKAIEKCPKVLGAQWQGDQLQIIIGQNVAAVYKMITENTNFTADSTVADVVDEPNNKRTIKSVFQAIGDGISGSLAPLIPLLVAGGMLKITVVLFELFGMSPDTGTYQVFAFCADAVFYFLPVFVGYGAARKFNANPGLGMLIGAILIAPDFVASVNEGAALDVLGIPIYGASYSSSVFPVLLSVFVMSYIERFISRYSPEFIRSVLVPFLTIAIMIPLTLAAFGPLGTVVGNYFADAVIWLYDTLGFIGVGLFAAFLPFVIFTGMHFGFFPYMFMMLGSGSEPFYCASNFIYNINQGAASLAVSLKSKDKEMKSLALSCGVSAIVAGVSEPSLFGVTFKLKTPLWCSMAGSFVGGVIVGLFHVEFYSFSSFGLVGLPGFIGPDQMNLIYMIAALVISAIATFALTMFIYKGKAEDLA